METLRGTRFRFDNFDLDCARRLLMRDGEPVELKPKAFDLLQYLVENHGKLVTKNELMERIWPGQFVEDNNLTVQMSSLRKVFGDDKNGPIRTVPGKGYTFVSEVFDVANDTELIIEQRSVSRMIIEEHEPVLSSRTTTATRSHFFTILAVSIPLLLAVSGFVYWQRGSGPEIRDYQLSKLTSSGDITSATITPDGNYAVFARKESTGESLWLRQIASGSQQQVLTAKPIRFVGLAISPDGNSIYATTFSPKLADPQIWRLPLLGGVVEEIKGITTGGAVSFSPDGKQIAYTESRSSMKETQLLISDADGSNKRVVARAADDQRSFPNFDANSVAWSPDGRSIACSVGEKKEGIKHGILLVDPQSGAERFVSESRWDYIDNLTWIDGDTIAFSGYTVEPMLGQILSVSISTGEVRQITKDLSNYYWLAQGSGKLLAVQRDQISHVSLTALDDTSDRATQREIHKHSGSIENVVFAGDGSIIYSSDAGGKREIWRMSADGTAARALTAGSDVTHGVSISAVDGSIFFSATRNGKHTLNVVSREGSDMRQLTDGPDDVYPSISPDGRSVFFQKGLFNKVVTPWKLDLDTGKQTQLSERFTAKPTLSPDGSQIAYYFMDGEIDGLWRVGLMSSLDGSLLNKLTFPKSVTERRMRWHPNGTALAQIFNEGDSINLLIMPKNGGEASVIRNIAKGDALWFDWSRDGKQIVISHANKRSDVVLLTK